MLPQRGPESIHLRQCWRPRFKNEFGCTASTLEILSVCLPYVTCSLLRNLEEEDETCTDVCLPRRPAVAHKHRACRIRRLAAGSKERDHCKVRAILFAARHED